MKNKMIGYEKAYGYIRLYYQWHFPHPVRASIEEILQILVDSNEIKGKVTRISAGSNFYKLTISTPKTKPNSMSSPLDKFQAELEEYLSSDDGMKDVVADIMQLHLWLRNNGYIDESSVATEKILSQSKI